MSDIPSFPYADLWEERQILSVANLTREDGTSFFELIGGMELHIVTQSFPLDQANQALQSLREGRVKGAAVLVPPMPTA